jgi:hypothetical protein
MSGHYSPLEAPLSLQRPCQIFGCSFLTQSKACVMSRVVQGFHVNMRLKSRCIHLQRHLPMPLSLGGHFLQVPLSYVLTPLLSLHTFCLQSCSCCSTPGDSPISRTAFLGPMEMQSPVQPHSPEPLSCARLSPSHLYPCGQPANPPLSHRPPSAERTGHRAGASTHDVLE